MRANDAETPVAVRGGGHNIAGLSTCDDGIVVDLSELKVIEVDPEAPDGPLKLVRPVEFDAATRRRLGTTGGVVGDMGIVALTLGGGLLVCGKYGMTIDTPFC